MSAHPRLWHDRGGATAAEFALVLPLLLLFMFGIIDAARFLWVFNQAEKATQMGVRFAAATAMVPSTLAGHDFTTDGLNGGDPVPTSFFGTATCTNTTCTCTGSAGACGFDNAAFNGIVARMNTMYAPITATNVQVQYENVGLGFAGDPNAPDVAPLVTVRLTGLQFTPISALLFTSFTMPDFRAALTLEDGSGTVSN